MNQGDDQLPWLPMEFSDDSLWLDGFWDERARRISSNSISRDDILDTAAYPSQNSWTQPQQQTSPWPSNFGPFCIPEDQGFTSNLEGPSQSRPASVIQLDVARVNNPADIGSQCQAHLLPMPVQGILTQSTDAWSLYPTDQPQSTPFLEVGKENLGFPTQNNASVLLPPIPGGERLPTNAKSKIVFSTAKRTKSSKGIKPRLRCTHAGCKLTFPRPYELQRHQSNVHERVFIPCVVYGCNRIAKPIARVDKFREHMRKHQDAHTFVCAVEGCPSGPFDRSQLWKHLDDDHDLEWCIKQLKIEERLLGIHLRINIRNDATRFTEENGNCPLSFLGCAFHAPRLSVPFGKSSYRTHVETHDLAERAKGFQALVEHGYNGWEITWGLSKCPMCSWTTSEFLGRFISHLDDHSKEDRKPHITGLWERLRPFEKYTWDPRMFQKVRNEYQEATGLDPYSGNTV